MSREKLNSFLYRSVCKTLPDGAFRKDSFQPLTTFGKRSNLDVWKSSEHSSALYRTDLKKRILVNIKGDVF